MSSSRDLSSSGVVETESLWDGTGEARGDGVLGMRPKDLSAPVGLLSVCNA
jgi:hypothetical protein